MTLEKSFLVKKVITARNENVLILRSNNIGNQVEDENGALDEQNYKIIGFDNNRNQSNRNRINQNNNNLENEPIRSTERNDILISDGLNEAN